MGNGDVLNVTKFLSDHPGGELAILTFAGKDATEEFNMIHPPDVVPKYAPDAIIGKVGTGAAAPVAAAATAAVAQSKGTKTRDYAMKNKNRAYRMEKEGKITGLFGALCYMVLGFLKEIIFTIFPQKNITLTNDRIGLSRSAMFLFVFLIIHAFGNLHVFLGPDDFNGYGYFYVRLYPSGFGLPANIVEEYVLLAAIMHVFIALKRTWDISLAYGFKSGQLNLAVSGVLLLTFMTIHLFQFRFGDTVPYNIRPPPYLINIRGILTLSLFWCTQEQCPYAPTIGVRDIYKLEFDIFQRPTNFPFGPSCGTQPFSSLGWDQALPCQEVPNFWAGFYIFSVLIFMVHACLGWKKVVPALGVPMGHHKCVNIIGYMIFLVLGVIYISFPAYVMMTPKRWCGWEAETDNALNQATSECQLDSSA